MRVEVVHRTLYYAHYCVMRAMLLTVPFGDNSVAGSCAEDLNGFVISKLSC